MSNFLWTQKQDIGPKARRAHAMSYDSTRGRSILFGGVTIGDQLFNDTWEWDGDLWTQVGDMGPAARQSHAMAYDKDRDRTIIFGGIAGNQLLGDTWEWDGENWTQLSNSGPQPRSGHALVYNSTRKRIILFGGESAGGMLNDTWEFDGQDWVQLGDTGPSPRKLHSMAYDNSRDRVVLFGGTNNNNNGLNDTWEWNGENWTQVSDFGPPSCLGGTMVSMNSFVALFGGVSSVGGNGPVVYDNTWGWNGSHWTQYQDIGPSARWQHAAVFDTQRTRLMVFGGLIVPIDPANTLQAENFVGDTWEHLDTAPVNPSPGPNSGDATISEVRVEPDSTPISGLGAVTVTAILGTITNEEVIVNLFFVPQTQIDTLPPGDLIPVVLNQMMIEAGEIEGHTTLAGASINETGVIFAQVNESSAQATLTITGP